MKYGRLFWVSVAVGWLVILAGVAGVLRDAERTHPANFVRFFVGSALAHDLVLAPLVFGVAAVAIRRVPPVVRPPLQAALIVGGVVTLFAFPFVRGYGQRADNPSALPNDYGAGLAWVLVMIGATAAAWAIVRVVRAATRD